MPASEAILAGLTTIANEWRALAVFWHAFGAAVLLAIAVRRDLSNRLVSALLVLPMASVSALAWASHNPFNGAAFSMLSLALAVIAHRLPHALIRIAPWPWVLAGAALAVFGWTYPHFLVTSHWSVYLIAAPMGLLPCPTLSVISGLTLVLGGFRSKAWQLTLAVVCVAYGTIGVVRLRVAIDVALLAGAAALVAAVAIAPPRPPGRRLTRQRRCDGVTTTPAREELVGPGRASGRAARFSSIEWRCG